MKVYHLPDGSTVGIDQQFQIADQKYPGGWLRSALPEDLAALGITVEEISDETPSQIPAPPPPISALDFRALFTEVEVEAITTAAQSNVALRIFLDNLSAAEAIHLDDPRIAEGISFVVAGGLITQDRANAILAGQKP